MTTYEAITNTYRVLATGAIQVGIAHIKQSRGNSDMIPKSTWYANARISCARAPTMPVLMNSG